MRTVRYPCSIFRWRAISAATKWQRPIASASSACASFKPAKCFLRNNQHMGWRFRIDILKGENVIIFVNFFGGDLAAKNATEKAVAARVGHGCALAENNTAAAGRKVIEANPALPGRLLPRAFEFLRQVFVPVRGRYRARALAPTSLLQDCRSAAP